MRAAKKAVLGGPEWGRCLGGWYLGSGDRAEAIRRFKRWVNIAAAELPTESIDQLASRTAMLKSADSEGGFVL